MPGSHIKDSSNEWWVLFSPLCIAELERYLLMEVQRLWGSGQGRVWCKIVKSRFHFTCPLYFWNPQKRCNFIQSSPHLSVTPIFQMSEPRIDHLQQWWVELLSCFKSLQLPFCCISLTPAGGSSLLLRTHVIRLSPSR